MFRTSALSIAVGLVLLFCGELSADDLKVLDHNGLTRSVRAVAERGRVVIKAAAGPNIPPELSLTSRDGIQADRTAVRAENDTFTFEDLTPGTWQVKTNGRRLAIESIRIESRQ